MLDFLTKYDLPVGLAMQLSGATARTRWTRCGATSISLSGEAFGVEFSVSGRDRAVDELSGDSSCRTEAGVLFELSHNEQSGRTRVSAAGKARGGDAQLLDGDTDTAEKALDDLLERGSVVQEQVANVEGCYLRRCNEAETYVVTRVPRHACRQAGQAARREEDHRRIERGQGIEYAHYVGARIMREELLILTGGPGTGKTTSVRGIVALFERMGLDVLLCAPTGRAAKRMGELCGKEAQTIHRLLGMSWNEQTGDGSYKKTKRSLWRRTR